MEKEDIAKSKRSRPKEKRPEPWIAAGDVARSRWHSSYERLNWTLSAGLHGAAQTHSRCAASLVSIWRGTPYDCKGLLGSRALSRMGSVPSRIGNRQ